MASIIWRAERHMPLLIARRSAGVFVRSTAAIASSIISNHGVVGIVKLSSEQFVEEPIVVTGTLENLPYDDFSTCGQLVATSRRTLCDIRYTAPGYVRRTVPPRPEWHRCQHRSPSV